MLSDRRRPCASCRDCITYCAREHEALQPDQHLRLSHLGSRRLAAARSGVHDVPTGIVYVEEVLKTGMDVDDVRAAPRVLLREPGRLLRGDREVPRRAARVREDHEDALRREEPGFDAAALPLPDGGGDAHQAAIPASTSCAPRCRRSPPCSAAAQSLHTNGYDEAFAIPTEDAMSMALRTQQIIADEINVASVVDPARRLVFRRKPDHANTRSAIFEMLD